MVGFYIKNISSSFKRGKLSFFLSFFTSYVAILLVVMSIFMIFISDSIQNNFRSKVTFNLFINDSLSVEVRTSLMNQLRKQPFTDKVVYVSKEQASEKFVKETGEDFRKVLDVNPLPSSLVLSINRNYMTPEKLQEIKSKVSQYYGVEEVVFQSEMVDNVLKQLDSINKYVLSSSIILILISLYIVYSNNKLLVSAKKDEIETMKLVGASLFTIKFPFILNSIFIGFLSSLLSLLSFAGIIFYLFQIGLINYTYNNYLIIFGAMILCIGPIIGIIAGNLGVKNINLRLRTFNN